jgi:3-phosphoshikimate 1-carboxyvinyltransferase
MILSKTLSCSTSNITSGMDINLPKQTSNLQGEIFLKGSKSISNRLLMIKEIGKLNINFQNLSDSNDTKLLKAALSKLNQPSIDVQNCGTAMRFLTSYLALTNYNGSLHGDERMHERPIKSLVEALQQLGCKIDYELNKGFPPLHFSSSIIQKNSIEIDATISSQFITSLLLCTPLLSAGLELTLKGSLVSQPYVKMSLQLMHHFGMRYNWDENKINIEQGAYSNDETNYFVEGDWSSASYWYSVVAVNKNASIKIHGLQQHSMQGDSVLPYLYSFLGVTTTFNDDNSISLYNSGYRAEYLLFDFSSNPDIAQTVAVTCAALNIPCQLNGLDNLNLKESKRIQTLALELSKCGAQCITTYDTLQIIGYEMNDEEIMIDTHGDHRIAMSFLPLCFKIPLIIKDAEVVNKSYPNFFEDAKRIGIKF